MKCIASLTVGALALANSVGAHYIFQQLAVAGRSFGVYEHIRRNTNYNSPVTSLTDADLRCNVGGGSGSSTSTVDVKAGDSFTFTTDVAVYHQGPVSVYMSKAPGFAAGYDGGGDWFKTFDWGPVFSGGQITWPLRSTYTHSIPACIPDGEYLLRIQSLAIHNPGDVPQFYSSCAQVRVTGGGSKTPSSTVKIPGFIKATDPGYTANIYNGLKNYTVPGGPVFTC
ncbi:endoglucanase II [Pyricularia oryzae 70-15]|uniref:lytic cellulose monooxygenase (C4-dehydrogenating) n=3 Tax=Pyricularia oryzae TaxID=318829 RepID=G4MS66_PYRO7|nr:endoglucanase II [Pyricularia oryzae 70-15]EHA58324.1 endoglucanase II [Pyricularia oryzae 70-15]ELQ33013.1 endoglucanase II [Pyricularia oryzae Y34]KAI7927999.1 endoglucanase II [Pyricularia oryzae]KAI7928491.1 endoglucanase II [Pyricularia oryzae]